MIIYSRDGLRKNVWHRGGWGHKPSVWSSSSQLVQENSREAGGDSHHNHCHHCWQCRCCHSLSAGYRTVSSPAYDVHIITIVPSSPTTPSPKLTISHSDVNPGDGQLGCFHVWTTSLCDVLPGRLHQPHHQQGHHDNDPGERGLGDKWGDLRLLEPVRRG